MYEHILALAARGLPLAALLLLAGCELATEAATKTSAAQRQATGDAADSRLHFVRGYEAGLREAQREQRPMLVFFTAQWCQFCHEMADQVFTDQQVVQLGERFVCILVDADTERWVCEQFGVQAFPTVQFLSPRGVPLKRLVGKKETLHVVVEMRQALQAIAARTRPQRRF